jgi:RimJ/RimL family protein N-acetyltransferase
MKASMSLTTGRLALRRPHGDDAEAIFARFSSDADVTRYVGWPRHQSVSDTHGFLRFSDAEWERWPAGPYLIFNRSGQLLGATGLSFETPFRASTGYVLARDAWGRGYATEALRAMVALAPPLGVQRLYAICHAEHHASARVLEKCAFEREGTLRAHTLFPNLGTREAQDVLCYASVFGHKK